MCLNRRDFLAGASAVALVPAGFVRGAAVPAGFDYRDPYSGEFMAFGLWYITCEEGSLMTSKGFESAEAAVEWYRANRDAGEQHGWSESLLGVVPADSLIGEQFAVLGDHCYSVVSASWYYLWLQKVGIDMQTVAECGFDARKEYEAAQQDPNWQGTWGGGG